MSLEIPIGGDLTGIQSAFTEVVKSTNNMGGKIGQAFAKANQELVKVNAGIGGVGGAAQNSMGSVVSASQRGVSGIAALGTAFKAAAAAAATAMAGIAAGIGVAMKGIGAASEIETLQTAFIPLLGSADAAQARLDELRKFAASTPFELPEIARASKTLEVLTKGALATGSALTLVGDAASAAGQPFDEVAMWIGRLYDGLQSGRPVGEAMMRLQEMGLISGDVRGRLEALQKSGAAGSVVWNEAAGALGRFSGSMELQSRTWGGQMSTLKDGISNALAEFGKPIMDALKPYLSQAITMAEAMGRAAADFGAKVGGAIRSVFRLWSSGELIGVIGDGMKLGFSVGINFLWASIRGIISAIGQGVLEVGRVAISMFQVLTTADFWKGMGNALFGIAISFVSMIQKGLAELMEIARPVAAVIGQAGKIDAAQASLRGNAAELDAFSAELYQAAGDQLGPAMAKVADQMTSGIGRTLDRFQEAYSSTEDVIPTDAIRNSIAEAIARVTPKDQAVDAASPSAAKPAGQTTIADSVAKAAAPQVMSLARVGGGGYGAPTILSNLYTEAKNQTRHLKTIAEKLTPGGSAIFA